MSGDIDVELSLDSRPYGGAGAFRALLRDPGGKAGIVLLHGRNGNPDGVVVGKLRRLLSDEGYTTLSLQNPVPRTGDEFADYVRDLEGDKFVFPEAAARVDAALAALRERGIATVALAGFSMGARMFCAYLARVPRPSLHIAGLVALSAGVNGPGPLDCRNSLDRVALPVLDISGAADKDVAGSAEQRQAAYERGRGAGFTRQVLGGEVPHNFAGAEPALHEAVSAWLKRIAPAR
jgi:dienelactone hydrolase